MWTCLACTDFDRSARCSSAQLDMAAELLSSLGSALFSLLCSGSALFATARGSSTRASAASLGLRLCLARVALFGLTGSAHDFRLSAWLGSQIGLAHGCSRGLLALLG